MLPDSRRLPTTLSLRAPSSWPWPSSGTFQKQFSSTDRLALQIYYVGGYSARICCPIYLVCCQSCRHCSCWWPRTRDWNPHCTNTDCTNVPRTCPVPLRASLRTGTSLLCGGQSATGHSAHRSSRTSWRPGRCFHEVSRCSGRRSRDNPSN